MSTLNVDIINPESVARVVVGGCPIEYDANRNLTVGDVISDLITSYDNTVVGNYSMMVLTSGTNNTAIGASVMQDCTTGSSNTSVGHSSLANLTTGGFNTALGVGAMVDSISGFNNTAIGVNAMGNSVSGNNNVAIGINSGLSTSGNNNVYIGYLSAQLQTSGNNNITIGNNASNSTTTASNEITLGNSANTVIRAAVTTITSLSDERDKKEIQDLPVGLEFVEKLKPVKFVWNDRDESGKHDVEDFGFIAQDLKTAQEESEASYLNLVYDENPEKLEASYGKLLPVLVKAIQEMSSEIKSLKEEILILKSK